MSSIAIRVDNLSKSYRLGETHARSLRDLINGTAGRLFRKAIPPVPVQASTAASTRMDKDGQFRALHDISFDVRSGEIVGIIGRNGAGKSTLLKILSNIVAPTSGRIALYGRVASLLEVGTGFHPELTGRENVFLNGAILGMTNAEVRRKFDEIVAFAEIERFIDTPAKRYSSGMYIRLAFAVAAHLDPEILIVDEVLAVGDASFQRKCLSKIGEVGRGGRTVLFVSHNMTAVKSLCSRALLVDGGEIVIDGATESAIESYLAASQSECRERDLSNRAPSTGDDGLRLCMARIISREAGLLTVDSSFGVQFDWENSRSGRMLNLSLHVHSMEGPCVFATQSPARAYGRGRFRTTCEIPRNLLNVGSYRFQIILVEDAFRGVLDVDDAVTVEIHDNRRQGAWYGKWPGVVRPLLSWSEDSTELDV